MKLVLNFFYPSLLYGYKMWLAARAYRLSFLFSRLCRLVLSTSPVLMIIFFFFLNVVIALPPQLGEALTLPETSYVEENASELGRKESFTPNYLAFFPVCPFCCSSPLQVLRPAFVPTFLRW